MTMPLQTYVVVVLIGRREAAERPMRPWRKPMALEPKTLWIVGT